MGLPSFDEWLDFMPETLRTRAFVSRSVSGKPSYSPAVNSYPCRVEMRNHKIVNRSGQEVLAKGKIFVGTTDSIGIDDLIILPAGYVPASPPLLDVNIQADESGTHHVTLEI